MKYVRKPQEVEAIRHPGPGNLTVVGKKGEQIAHVGDYVVIDGPTAHDRQVLTEKVFEELYEISDAK